MNIAKNIDFSKLEDTKIFDRNSKEYDQMLKLYNLGQWKEYSEELITKGISVRFDVRNDNFIVKPLNYQIKENWEQNYNLGAIDDTEEIEEENIDIESLSDDLFSYMDTNITQPDTNQPNNNQMQVVTLEDVLSIIKTMQLDAPQSETTDTIETEMPMSSELEDGDEALKKAFFQSEGNETLDSEFSAVSGEISTLENHIGATPYLDVIDGRNKITPEVPSPYPNKCKDLSAIGRNMSADDTSIKTRGTYNDNGEELNSLSTADRFLSGITNSDDNEEDIYSDDSKEFLVDEDEVQLQEDSFDGEDDEDYDFETMGHPDIQRISGNMDFSVEDEDEDLFYNSSDFEPEIEKPEAPLITKNEPMNLGGQMVQIVLTGVMITPVEMNYIAETINKTGAKLTKLQGKGNQLKMFVEANNNKYEIDYIDLPKYKAPVPFSIDNKKYGTLEEALERINFNRFEKETDVFKQIMTENISNREINNWKAADIFDNFKKDMNYNSAWPVMSVGMVNLKTGLNEAYSNITKHGKEMNTLVKNETNTYFLIKGNLKEMSKIGTKREMLDVRNKKNLGIITVVGIYENDAAGLGEIMYEAKKTNLPLYIWK